MTQLTQKLYHPLTPTKGSQHAPPPGKSIARSRHFLRLYIQTAKYCKQVRDEFSTAVWRVHLL